MIKKITLLLLLIFVGCQENNPQYDQSINHDKLWYHHYCKECNSFGGSYGPIVHQCTNPRCLNTELHYCDGKCNLDPEDLRVCEQLYEYMDKDLILLIEGRYSRKK